MDQPEYKTQYDAYLSEIMNGAFKPESMQAEYLRLYNLIKPFTVGADGETKPYSFLNSNAEFDAALSTLNTHVTTRYNAAINYLH
jgi:hypothetical protein